MKRMASAFLAGLGLLSLMGIARAADEPYHAQGVFCDTVDEARAFLKAWDGSNTDAALDIANAGTPKACGTAEVLVTESQQYDTVVTQTGQWLLVQVNVVAQFGTTGISFAPAPVVQYTARKTGAPGTDI